jgi:hypothetical protein
MAEFNDMQDGWAREQDRTNMRFGTLAVAVLKPHVTKDTKLDWTSFFKPFSKEFHNTAKAEENSQVVSQDFWAQINSRTKAKNKGKSPKEVKNTPSK